MGRPRKEPADIVLEKLRLDVPVIMTFKLNRLINRMIRIAMDDTRMPKERESAVKSIDLLVGRVMDVLGQPQRPKPAVLGKRRKGSGAIDMDQVIDANPVTPGMEVVPAMPKGTPKVTGETMPTTMDAGMEQFA